MPRLHKYRDRNAHYVLTAVRGAVVTFQLTPDGERRLREAGVDMGQRFPRALLLDLYRTGDAFTHGSGVNLAAVAQSGQMELDFAQDPDPETAFPACDACGSLADLHLQITGEAGKLAGSVLCLACRLKPGAVVDTSIPITLLTRAVLLRLLALKPLASTGEAVGRLRALLEREFESKWAALRKQTTPRQGTLLDVPPRDGLGL